MSSHSVEIIVVMVVLFVAFGVIAVAVAYIIEKRKERSFQKDKK